MPPPTIELNTIAASPNVPSFLAVDVVSADGAEEVELPETPLVIK
jgi:hypothetical protein